MQNDSLQDLVKLSQENTQYIAELWTKLEPECRYFSRTYARNFNEQEDLFFETYTFLSNSLKSYNPTRDASIKTYFRKYLTWKGLNHIRNGKDDHDYVVLTDLNTLPELPSETFNPEREVLLSEQKEILLSALDSLKPSQKKLILELFIEEKRIAELALEYQVTPNQIECSKRRILNKLKTQLENKLK